MSTIVDSNTVGHPTSDRKSDARKQASFASNPQAAAKPNGAMAPVVAQRAPRHGVELGASPQRLPYCGARAALKEANTYACGPASHGATSKDRSVVGFKCGVIC